MENCSFGVIGGDDSADSLKCWAQRRGAKIVRLDLDEDGGVDCVVFEKVEDSDAYFEWLQRSGTSVMLLRK